MCKGISDCYIFLLKNIKNIKKIFDYLFYSKKYNITIFNLIYKYCIYVIMECVCMFGLKFIGLIILFFFLIQKKTTESKTLVPEEKPATKKRLSTKVIIEL
jgi:cellulose synthase/poly-beta-1,6-N-acetylglucosamine synthase-like glycosyltransferase